MDISNADRGTLAFGRFCLDLQRRVLLHDGTPLKLTPKAFDTLLYLVTNPGRVVDKDELLAAVWGERVVEEANLAQTIFGIRKALHCEAGADRWIVTAPGRGYRFTAAVVRTTNGVLQQTPAIAGPPTAANIRALPRAPAGAAWWRGRVVLGVAAALLVASTMMIVQMRPNRGSAPTAATAPFLPPPHSVAVLAFTNMSADPSQTYLSDGLADELINTLSRIDGLQVAARTSAFTFKTGSDTIGEIARKLNVGAVLEGAVHRDGDHVQVTVQLINAATGYPIWSHAYERSLGNTLAMQVEIATAVAEALRGQLLGEQDLARLAVGGTKNGPALDAYLRGKQEMRLDIAYKEAVTAFETAIALDPNFALARVRRSEALRDVVNHMPVQDAAQMSRLEEDSIAEAERAITLAPDLGIAHSNLGDALEEGRLDFRRAADEFVRGRDLAPGDVETIGYYAESQSHLGHAQQAITAAQFVVGINPLSAQAFRRLAAVFTFAGRYDDALAAARHMVQLRGHATPPDEYLVGEIQLLQGRTADALNTCGADQSWPMLHCRAMALFKLGRRQEAADAMASLRAAMGDSGAMQYATVYAQWGQPAEAQRWLETAYRLRDPGLIELKVLPLLDPIRDTPVFKGVLRQLDFPS